MFGNSFEYVTFHNYDYDKWCTEKGITGYPTLVFSDGSILIGKQSFEALAEKTGCSLP
jgi:hypothetical protein